MADPVLVDFNNSVIRQSDLELLQGPNWLNDRLIGFWFEYLEHEVFRKDKLCFISPEVTQFIKFASKEEVALFLEPLNIESKDYILLAINDSWSCDTPGGSHWSLLVFSRPEQAYFHLDSLHHDNLEHATKIAKTLNLCNSHIIELPSLQQSNGWDCGIHVCCNAELVAKNCIAEQNLLQSLPKLDFQTIAQQRDKMIKAITSLSSV